MPRDPAVGRPMERREDPALLSGRADFVDDRQPPGCAHLAIHRSQYAHATVEAIDTAPVAEMDGVIAVYTWADLANAGVPGVLPVTSDLVDAAVPGHPVLARDRVRYQGQPIAAVVATDRSTARDAAEAVAISYERRDAVTDPVAALEPNAPTLFEAAPDNVALDWTVGDRDAVETAMDAADHVVERDLRNNRLLPSAIEPRAALARYDHAADQLTVEMTSQAPSRHRHKLARTLGRPERAIRVIAPAVGGGFGHKGHHHPGEALAAFAATDLARPVKWVATRSENFLAGAHAREHRTTARLAFDDDGRFRALAVDTTAGLGAYALGAAPNLPTHVYAGLLSGQYAIPAIHAHVVAAYTTTAPVHSYRGAGRPEAIYVLERLVNAAASELDVDPADLRRRNLIPADAFPYETAVGSVYDSGEYERALETVLDAVDYAAVRDDRRPDAAGRYRGVGLGSYVESTGGGFESGVVRVHPDGGVTVYAGTHDHGQGHGTTYAQVVADALGIPPADVSVVDGDTGQVPHGTGTFGSRSAIMGGNAIAESAEKVLEQAREIAAGRLEVAPADVAYADGTFRVAGAPDRSVGFGEVAATAYGGDLPAGLDPGLEATTFYRAPDRSYTFGTHAAVVAVDPETGDLDIERYVAVDDCGDRINPRIVEGQVHGGVAQGLGQALQEHARYDDGGNLVTATFQDYAMPRASHLPSVETDFTVTPSPRNPLGVKGIGEAGTIAAPPAVVNAVLDALAPLGVTALDMPLTPETIWRACREATSGGNAD